MPKALQLAHWGAQRLSPGMTAYAASDAVLAWNLFADMRPKLKAKGRLAAYELQRDALPAVVEGRFSAVP